MPYTMTVTAPGQGRTGHRRSFSHITAPPALATTTTTGAFSSLGALPTRKTTAATTSAGTKKPTFQLGRDDDEDSPDEDHHRPRLTINTRLHDDDDSSLPPLRLKSKPSSSIASVPFPRSSPPPPEQHQQRPVRPTVTRTASHSIVLSTGKPLKSSLKSSSSSPNIPFPPQSLVPSIMFPHLHLQHHHQRARSAPSTPHLSAMSDPMDNLSASTTESPISSSPGSSPPPSPPPSKNVHFPSQEEGGLTTVKLFNRTAKPASLLRIGDETETETEGESSSAPNGFGGWGSNRWGGYGYAGAGAFGRAYPFPKVPAAPAPVPVVPSKNVLHDVKEEPKEADVRFEIDMKNSTPIPARGAERADGNIYFESLGFVCEPGTDKLSKPLRLTGTVLVRNITFQKTVAVRFTLDDWHTTNDVLAKHEKSLRLLPERFLLASLPTDSSHTVSSPYHLQDDSDVTATVNNLDLAVPAWDRFRFDISLASYESTLDTREMIFVGRYTAGMTLPSSMGMGMGMGDLGGGFDGGFSYQPEEWWDNNGGMNYRIKFAKAEMPIIVPPPVSVSSVPALVSPPASAPASAVPPSMYKRNVVYSAPPVFAPSKPHPSPPQITSSNSFPAPSVSPGIAKERQEALTQSTLSRLKKLNLRNYAAPKGSSGLGFGFNAPNTDENVNGRTISTSSADSSASGSTVTSTDSTPIQTPTLSFANMFSANPNHDVEVDVLGGDDDGLRIREDMSTPRPTIEGLPITSSPVPFSLKMQDGFPATSFSPPPIGAEMGTSPPFSSMGMDDHNKPWAWESFGVKKDEKKEEESKPEMKRIDSKLQMQNGASNPLSPPQRRRNGHSSSAHPHANFTLKVSSSSSSGSGSGSDTSKGTRSHHQRDGSTWKRGAVQAQPQPTKAFAESQPYSSLQWPLSRPMSPTSTPTPASLGSTAAATNNSASGTGQDDALYQAFVRQWCFASGPTPAGADDKERKVVSAGV